MPRINSRKAAAHRRRTYLDDPLLVRRSKESGAAAPRPVAEHSAAAREEGYVADETTTEQGNGPVQLEDAPDIRGFVIPRPKMRRATLRLIGISPLIQHQWSEKAARKLEDAQTGKAKGQKEPRDPEEEFRAAAYVIPGHEDDPDGTAGKYYHPAASFKHAFLYGVSQLGDVKGFPKTKATAWVFIDLANGEPVLEFDYVRQRFDIGRNPTQPVYRPEFGGWKVNLDIIYNGNTITPEQIVSLFDLGGMGGIGEWRPSAPKNKTGDFGRFYVESITERR